MAEFLVKDTSLTAVADAIREKGGTTAPLSFPAGMAKAVRGIPSGGTDISLGLTAATVGQTVKVKAVDTDGKPTEWEAVDAVGAETWEKIDVIPLTAGVTLYDIANFSGYTKIAISMVKPMTKDGSGTVQVYIYKKSNPDSSITSYIIDSGFFKGAYGYIELAKDEPFLRYIQLFRNNVGTPGTGGIGIPKDNLDLTDLGAVKIVLPEAYSQNFDGTGTLTIRGLK
jgi:hypothetical protein